MAEPITNVLGTVAIKHCGEYDATMHYEKLNVVTYNGSSYCAKDNTIGNLPTNTEYWDLMAEKGSKGDTGNDGYTPVKGTDYYTEADKDELEGTLSNDVTTEVTSQLSNLTSATPLAASSTAGMTDTTRIYVNTNDGHWYWYDGTEWQDGGVYQATEDSTTLLEVKNITDNITDISFSQEVHTLETGYLTTNNTVATSFGKHIIAEVTPGETIQFSCTASANLRAYILRDSSHNIVSMASQDASLTAHTNESIIIPSGVAEIVINTSNSLTIAFYRSNIKVPYSAITIPDNSIKKNKLEEFISNLFIDKYENIEFTPNTGSFISYTTGDVVSQTGTNYTEVEVNAGEKYKVTGSHSSNLKLYILKDSNNNIIEYYPTTSSSYTKETKEIEIPQNGYLYVNSYSANTLNISKLTGYEINSSSNPLLGKKVLFFGDSITAGNGSWAQPSTIMGKNNMIGSNYGVGGMTYTVTSSSNATNNIYLRIQNKASEADVDYVIFQGGVNDAFRSYTVGDMSNLTDFTSNLDTSNFSGAFEMAVRFILTNWPGAKVGFIANAKIPRNSNLGTYMDRAKEICKKYSVPFLDLYNESGLCAGIQSINDTYYIIDSDYSTEHSGGTHPTPEGYAKYLNNKVEAFMNRL